MVVKDIVRWCIPRMFLIEVLGVAFLTISLFFCSFPCRIVPLYLYTKSAFFNVTFYRASHVPRKTGDAMRCTVMFFFSFLVLHHCSTSTQLLQSKEAWGVVRLVLPSLQFPPPRPFLNGSFCPNTTRSSLQKSGTICGPTPSHYNHYGDHG